MSRTALVALLAVGGCSNILGIEDLHGNHPGDGPHGDGAHDGSSAFDANIPTQLRLSGLAKVLSAGASSPAMNTDIEFIQLPNFNTLATATTDGIGGYILVLTTNNQPIDGFVLATSMSGTEHPSTTYVPHPLIGNTVMPVAMLDLNYRQTLETIGGVSANVFGIGLATVIDAGGNPLAGATVSTTDSTTAIRYADSANNPSTSAPATSANGLAYLFDLTVDATWSAQSGMLTFQPQMIVTTGNPDVFAVIHP